MRSRHVPFQSNKHHTHSRTCVRTAAVTVSKSTQLATRRPPSQLPVISYSTNVDDIVLEDLAALYCTVARHHSCVGASAPQQSLTAHWQRLSEEQSQHLLHKVLGRSIAVAAAYTRDPYVWGPEDVTTEQQQQQEASPWQAPPPPQQQLQEASPVAGGSELDTRSSSSSNGSSSSSTSSVLWVASTSGVDVPAEGRAGSSDPAIPIPCSSSGNSSTTTTTSSSSSSMNSSSSEGGAWRWGWRRPRKRLVAFARAAGDRSLVATVQDVLVHPKLQGLGIGTQLLRKLTAQLAAQDVWEVGALTTTSLTPFLAHSGFEPDKEASLPMVLPLDAAARLGAASARLRSNFELQQLLLDKM